MLKKLTILSLVLLAVAVVATLVSVVISPIAALFGDPAPDHANTVVVTEDELPGALDRGPRPSSTPLESIGTSTDGSLHLYDDQTRQLKQEYFWAFIEPHAGGVFDVIEPRARFHLSPHRVIQMQAETGQFVAPSNRPQRGRLAGNLVITVYESPIGVPLNLSENSPHVSLRLALDEQATFDATLGKIESTGPLRLVAPGSPPHRVQFVGRGLLMVYNEPESRVDYLEIRKGEYLKYLALPDAEHPQAAGVAAVPDAESEPQPRQTADSPQYYRVTFNDEVKVVSEGRTIDADQLEILFGFSRQQAKGRPLSRAAPAGSFVWPVVFGRALNPVPLVMGQTSGRGAGPAPARPAHPLLRDVGGDDVTLTWSGPMLMKPLRGRPVALRHQRDVQMTFHGEPVVARSPRGDQITCRKLTYLDSRREFRAIGSPALPLVLASPALGTARADQLVVHLDANTAALFGAGELQAHPPGHEHAGQGLPEGFAVRWSDRLALELTDADRRSLRSATFIGDVDLVDRRVKVKADRLHADFQPAGEDHQPQLHQVHATGDVDVRSDTGRIRADDLRITTRTDASGDLVPHVMKGKGDVRVEDPTQSFTAGVMEVQLGDSPQTTADGRRALSQRVEHIVAWEDVKLKLDDNTQVSADRIEADAIGRTADLLGSPVEIVRGESTLRVTKLKLEDDGRLASATGAGEFLYTEPDTPLEPGRKVKVTWTDSMRFADATDEIQVHGDVVAEASDDPAQLNRLSAGQVAMELSDARATEGEAINAGRRILRKVTAKQDVVLLGRKWTDATRSEMALRLRATGPVLEFDNSTETARILGSGALLIEDYRKGKAEPAMSGVEITGRGATLFTWSRLMEMHGAKTAMVLEGNARMSHWPAAGAGTVDMTRPPTVDLQCNVLAADLAGIGGMQAMRLSETGATRLDRFTADGRVQLRHRQAGRDRLISCHRLDYDGGQRRVDLTAQPGRNVEIIQTDQPKPARAASIRWDLKNDRLEMRQAGY